MKAGKAQMRFLMAILCANWQEVYKATGSVRKWARDNQLIRRGYGPGAIPLRVTDEGMEVIRANTPTAKGVENL